VLSLVLLSLWGVFSRDTTVGFFLPLCFSRCNITIKSQFLTILGEPDVPGWTVTQIAATNTLTAYRANTIEPYNYGSGPFVFNITVRASSDITYAIPGLMAMTCFYRSYIDDTRNGVSNTGTVQALSNSADTNRITNITLCPTAMPTRGKYLSSMDLLYDSFFIRWSDVCLGSQDDLIF